MQKWIKTVFVVALLLTMVNGTYSLVPPAVGAPRAGTVASVKEGVDSPSQPTEGVSSPPAEVPPAQGLPASVRMPLSISSEEMTIKGLEDRVVFKGAVVIQRGDVTIKAGRAEVFLSDFGKGSDKGAGPSFSAREGKEISRIELLQDVDLTQDKRHVVAQRGIYHAYREEILFTGAPEMWEEGYHVKGTAITISLKQKRSVVEGSQLTIQ